METSEKDKKYFRAKDRVDGIKKFYTSLMSYVFFITFLAGLNYWLDGWSYPWFL
ncbi:MAG: 2TM domain-containing protein, partial [Maribacter sp.]|nr:2TM domain-containing protein [Maribacter sp.]